VKNLREEKVYTGSGESELRGRWSLPLREEITSTRTIKTIDKCSDKNPQIGGTIPF
jgi:hypothetical protein